MSIKLIKSIILLLCFAILLSFPSFADDGVAGEGSPDNDDSSIISQNEIHNNSIPNKSEANDNNEDNSLTSAEKNSETNTVINNSNGIEPSFADDGVVGEGSPDNGDSSIISQNEIHNNSISNKSEANDNNEDNNLTSAEKNSETITVIMNSNEIEPLSKDGIELEGTPDSDSYSDIADKSWYASDVAKATELGLINGYDGKFYPNNNLTYSEAVKLAACMHQLKTTGKVTLVNGTKNWYDTYVEYAKQNKIITKDYDWTANATRAGYVEIFAHALPDDALSAKNTVADGAIPDVAMSDYAAKEIYKLYRAGILTGSDAKGTFNPDSNILRCEVAAILTRMMDESARKTISLS